MPSKNRLCLSTYPAIPEFLKFLSFRIAFVIRLYNLNVDSFLSLHTTSRENRISHSHTGEIQLNIQRGRCLRPTPSSKRYSKYSFHFFLSRDFALYTPPQRLALSLSNNNLQPPRLAHTHTHPDTYHSVYISHLYFGSRKSWQNHTSRIAPVAIDDATSPMANHTLSSPSSPARASCSVLIYTNPLEQRPRSLRVYTYISQSRTRVYNAHDFLQVYNTHAARERERERHV